MLKENNRLFLYFQFLHYHQNKRALMTLFLKRRNATKLSFA